MPLPFEPDELPLANLDYQKLIGPVSDARAALAEYNALLSRLENPELMLSPLTSQEAVLSSRIEGTQATLEEVLEYDAGRPATGEKLRDIQEVINYRNALSQAHDALQEMPITLWLIRQMHQTLLNSARGRDKSPGEFRNCEVIIGPPGARTREEATYVPPVPEQVDTLMKKWETYVSYRDLEPLVQTAIMHAQFEIIHPFMDGNGRIGRLLIPLYMYQRKLLSQPMFYMSGYLETNRTAYYTALRHISEEGDWVGWIKYFLHGVETQAVQNATTISMIDELRSSMQLMIEGITRSLRSSAIVRALFKKPVFNAKDFVEETGLNRQTAAHNLRQLKTAGVLSVVIPASGSSPELLVFSELILAVNRATSGQPRGLE